MGLSAGRTSNENMSGLHLDLLLGGRIGAWVLDQVDPAQISHVWTLDGHVAERAKGLGIDVRHGLIQRCHRSSDAVSFSVHYPAIVPEDVLSTYARAYNIHPGFLPWGRGWYPVFWSLYAGEPAGASLHVMTAQLDQGPVVEQIRVPYAASDSGGSLHTRVQAAEMDLFLRWWPRIKAGEVPPAVPQEGEGSHHTRGDFERLRSLETLEGMSAGSLVRLARCLSHPDHPGLTVKSDGVTHEITWRRGKDR